MTLSHVLAVLGLLFVVVFVVIFALQSESAWPAIAALGALCCAGGIVLIERGRR